ncbi:SLM1 family PH domain-containing protein [Aspergillus stella-maris]|uniref:SLM1 family PH domain-containing protein n=1 Tax=Aspergillus stella-maris TaxID=1810926 RepID=UPI003CCD50A6
MATLIRSQTPVQDHLRIASAPHDTPLSTRGGLGRSNSARPHSFAAGGSGYSGSQLGGVDPAGANMSRFNEEFDRMSMRGGGEGPSSIQRSQSQMSHARSTTPTRSGTLKKKTSLSKRGSLRRSGSRRSMRAGSVRSLALGDREKYAVDGDEDFNSAFYIPVPTTGNPTEVLAERFQAWRKVIKDLIVFFKELQKQHEARAKLYVSSTNIMNNTSIPTTFLKSGGLGDATEILTEFHRQAHYEMNKAAEVESEVINQLVGLRNDLQKKTKEIKALSGDFKNSVDKEVDSTRKSVRHLHEALGLVDTDPSATSGKGDPFIVRLGVEKQVEKQIEEENYLHHAYLNLEKSGRELESIVVSEIQKAYNAYAGILKREADQTLDTVDKLRAGPVAMERDHEWNTFVANTEEMVDPRIRIRHVDSITYPGKDHPAAAEVRSGMLERKSKYLKSYAPGWYVLSPTHLHEFKSADNVAWQTPVMSLYLPEQKLGSHSQPDSTSHKFMLKGRQTGTMHRGHSWVFRAESYETMMAWYEDIERLISMTGEARNAYVRRHVRSVSGASFRSSSDGVMDEDEADRTPYSAESVVMQQERPTSAPRQPGGKFPSDVNIDRHLHAPLSPSSGESSNERDLLAATGSLPDAAPFLGVNNRFYGERDNDSIQISNPSRAASAAGGANRFPIDGYDNYGQPKWMTSSDSFNRQHQQFPQQAPTSVPNGVNVERPQEATNTLYVAGLGSAPVHDPASQHRGRNRGESSSTAFTNTNITDYTHNTVNTGYTVPTSVEEESVNDDETVKHKPLSVDDSGMSSLSNSMPNSVRNSINIPKRPSAQTENSVSTIELHIPGHYPPQQAAA